MSLNYDLSRIPEYRTRCFLTYTGTTEEMHARVSRVTFMAPSWAWTDETKTAIEALNPTTTTLVFATMHVGLSEITHENWQEFFERLHIVESLLTVFRTDADKKPVPFTPEEVKAHIGLRVNVGDTTKREFHAMVIKWVREDARRALMGEEGS
jgi:hypothetical protein